MGKHRFGGRTSQLEWKQGPKKGRLERSRPNCINNHKNWQTRSDWDTVVHQGKPRGTSSSTEENPRPPGLGDSGSKDRFVRPTKVWVPRTTTIFKQDPQLFTLDRWGNHHNQPDMWEHNPDRGTNQEEQLHKNKGFQPQVDSISIIKQDSLPMPLNGPRDAREAREESEGTCQTQQSRCALSS